VEFVRENYFLFLLEWDTKGHRASFPTHLKLKKNLAVNKSSGALNTLEIRPLELLFQEYALVGAIPSINNPSFYTNGKT
jgi:hypothetical protein